MKEDIFPEAFLFDYDTGIVTVILSNKEKYTYITDEGIRLAKRFDKFIQKAFKQYYKDEKEKERVKGLH